ncbi:MAG: MFS transporter [Actinobacteria bacterium]|nr:MFS transporter [Actinomycetota bacterium]
MVGISRRVRALAVDLAPLRSRDFRLLWTGEIFSETGSNVTLVAVYIQVYRLTGSPAAVGAIGLVQLAPLMAASLFGGPVIDRHDRRRLLAMAQVAQAGASALLLAGALMAQTPLVLVYVAAGLIAGLSGFSLATRSAMTPNLVPRDRLPSALALNQVMWNTALIVGPALGGLIVGSLGLAWAYGIDLASFSATIVAVLLMRPHPPADVDPDEEVLGSWRRLGEGFRFLKGRRVLQSTFVIDLVAMTFGMPRALFPVLAVTQFGGASEIVGILFSAVSVGALVGALTTGWVHRVRRQGLAIVASVAVWGSAIVAFGLVGDRILLACLCLAVAGGADVVSAVFRSTILQATVPDALRGRLSGIHITVVAGGPRVGDFEAGVVASAFTPAVSVVSGGLLCLVGVGLLALVVPELPRYRAGDPA